MAESKCGCVVFSFNNETRVKFCKLHEAAAALLALLTEGLGVEPHYDFADDLEALSSFMGTGFPTAAAGLQAKAEAIRAAVAAVKGGQR